MTKSTHTVEAIKAAIEHLIDRATNYDIEALEHIYHDDLHITMINPDKSVKTANKKMFQALFAARKAQGDAQMNTWADWHHIHINKDNAVVVLSRINSVGGEEMKLECSIDLVFEEARWQVIREEIFFRPLEG